MNPAAPDGEPPRRISVCKNICKQCTAPPCLGEALRRGALTGFNNFHGSGVNREFMPGSPEPKFIEVQWVCVPVWIYTAIAMIFFL